MGVAVTNPLRTYGVCENCGAPVHTDADPKRGWVHTETGDFSCIFSGGVTGTVTPLELTYVEPHVIGEG